MIARRRLDRRRASRTDREGGVLSAGDQPSGDEAGGDQIFEKRLQETAPVRPLAGGEDMDSKLRYSFGCKSRKCRGLKYPKSTLEILIKYIASFIGNIHNLLSL